MSAEIMTEKIIVAPGEPATRQLGSNEFVNASAPSGKGLLVIGEIRFADEAGEHYRLTVTDIPQGSIAMNTRDGSREYHFTREK